MNTAQALPMELLLVNLAVSVVLPHVVALVTKRLAASWFKGLLLLFLASLSGALTQLTIDTHGFQWQAWLLSWAQTFGAAVIVHYGLTKGLTTGIEGIIAKVIPQGVGPEVHPPITVSPATPVFGREARARRAASPTTGQPKLDDSDTSRY